MSQDFSVIIGRGIVAPGHDREVVDGLNDIDKSFLLRLIPTVQLMGKKDYHTKMVMHNGNHTSDVSLAREFQKHLSNATRKHGVIY